MSSVEMLSAEKFEEECDRATELFFGLINLVDEILEDEVLVEMIGENDELQAKLKALVVSE